MMTAIEIMALAVVVFAGVKLPLTFITPKSWKIWWRTVTQRTWTNPVRTTVAMLLLMVVSLAFLLRELTIIQIFAATLFGWSLVILGFAPFSKEMLEVEEKMFKQKEKGWLAALVWAILIVWVLYALFFGK